MVDVGIKQIRIPKSEFPLVQITTTTNELLDREEVDGLHYDFRYRIVSEDKNRFSHWSEIIRYAMPNVTTPFPYTASTRISVANVGDVINVVWSFPNDSEIAEQIELEPEDPDYMSIEEANYIKFFRDGNVYDIWIRWNNSNTDDPEAAGWSNWELSTTISNNNFSIIKPAGRSAVDVAIQLPSIPKVRDYYNNKLTLFRKTQKGI
jgi:hypothetical protein